jgi:hypothetical protein
MKKIKKRTVHTSLINVHGSTYVLLPKKIWTLYDLNECKHINLNFGNDKLLLKPLQEGEP